MPNYSSSANIVLSVNGKQAKQMLTSLEKDAKRLQQQLDKATLKGDTAGAKRLQKELTATNRLIEQMKGSAASVDNVLRRLDSATPKELNKALRTLQQQLSGIQRGTAAWDAHVAKIKAVKAELQRVNATMATQRSLWDRMNVWLNNCQTAILGIGAAITGLVMAGRKAVNAYAEMGEELANTRKYTGLSVEAVEQLNAAFRKMDTRTSREQLNELAQEAGRLGKNTLDSVMGYVEAADIINVALVDLGSGATQTIAKLTNIFGVEEMLGTRDAMLAVGSTVNVLSQNCTASKPYLVEFAQRMAGIGSQAGLTIPQILAFGAVLDANGQKVEMSATAIQKVIMNLANKNHEFAQTLGLDAEKLNATLKMSAKDGLLMFLEALQKMGQDVGFNNATMTLAPAFKEMGLDAARVSQVLSTLAMHLDEVKWQMGEADKAFREASSDTHEYEIFNNTAQASIDKAKKRVNELAIELGEKLYPVMKHIYTSSGIFLRALNVIITFLITYGKQLAIATAAIIAYNVALKASTIATNLHYAALVLVSKAQAAWTGLLAAGRGAIVLFRVAVIALTRGLGSARVAFSMLTKTMAANPWGAVATAIAAATAALIAFFTQTKRNEEATKRLSTAMSATNSAIEEEQDKIDKLFAKLNSAEKGSRQYQAAKDEIISKYGTYLRGLGQEIETLGDVAEAYRIITMEAKNAAKARGLVTANQATNEAFDQAVDTHGRALYAGLASAERTVRTGNTSHKEGLTRNEVARWVRTLTEEATARSFSQESKDFLRTIGVWIDRNGQFQGLDDVADALNGIKQAALDRDDELWVNNAVFGTPTTNYEGMDALQVERFMNEMRDALNENYAAGRQGKSFMLPNGNYLRFESNTDLVNELSQLEVYLERLQSLDEGVVVVANTGNNNGGGYTPPETEKERKARLRKERQEFKNALNDAKGDWEAGSAQNTTDYSAGLKSWTEYLEEKHRLEMQYFDDRMAVFEQYNLQEDEDYQELLKKKAEAEAAWLKRKAALTVDEAKLRQRAEEVQAQMDFATPTSSLYQNEEALQQRLFEIKIDYLRQMQAAYNETSEEYHNYAVQIEQAQDAERLRRQQLLSKRIQEWRKKYEYQQAGERLNLELDLLNEAHDKMLISDEEYYRARRDLSRKYAEDYLPESAKPQSGSAESIERDKARDLQIVESLEAQGVITHEQAEKAKDRISRTYEKKHLDRVRKFGSTQTNQLLDIYEAWKNFFDATEEDGGNWATRLAALASSVFAVMSAGMQQASEFIQAETDLQVAKTEKKYDREIEMAEGNSFKVRKAEKAKERELAKIKSESAKKQFAMQVIQAVAQTATNALNAYGSAAAVPVIGYILAPIAAAMAVAAGAIQIATIKKQQQASEAQGYAEGGFTPPGRRDEAVGVVHAGEWVASQKLVNNPRTRPLLEALDYAQRTNTIGSLRMDDVSRAVTAPMRLAEQQSAAQPVTNIYNTLPADNSDLVATIAELRQRLSEPFFTVNTVAGDLGYEKAKSEYDKLLRNKTPKSKR